METVTLYTRPGCGLCDEMKAELTRRGYAVREVDIDQDEALARQYGWDIPVVVRGDGTRVALQRLPPGAKARLRLCEQRASAARA
jgi:glutaredoxin